MATQTITGDDAIELIERELAAHSGGIAARLAPFEPTHTIRTWHATIRAVEEFINIPLFGVQDQALALWLMQLPLGRALEANPELAIEARDRLAPLFGDGVAQRFMLVMLRISRFADAWEQQGQGLGEGFGLATVAEAWTYFQSRRRHLLALLYMMAGACRGSAALDPSQTFGELLPVVEHCCISVTGWHNKALLWELFPDFALYADAGGGRASHEFDPLEGAFLEPERASIMTMFEMRPAAIASTQLEPVDPRRIFSAAELRNNVRIMQSVYEDFGVNDGAFAALSRLIIAFAMYCEDDYYITLELGKFRAMLAAQSAIPASELERLLVNRSSGYAACTNAYEPFIESGGQVISNVVLLSRFLYAFKNVHLGSRKRFQIHTGFIFEDQVKADLAAAGFQNTKVKRINRQEFDAVALLDGAIYNFQCKNNWVDLTKVESNRKLYARYNRGLVRYYKSALSKEAKRESLLKATLGVDAVKHFVVSRFPVISDDPRIIPYNRFPAEIATMANQARAANA